MATLRKKRIKHGNNHSRLSFDCPPILFSLNTHLAERLVSYVREKSNTKIILWKKWKLEYLLELRDRHNFTNGKNASVKIGDIAQIKVEQENRGELNIGWITKITFANDILVGVKINSGNNTIMEGPVQMSCLLEVSGDVMNNEDNAFTRNENKTCELG